MVRFQYVSSLKMTALVCRWHAIAHNHHHTANPVAFQLSESSSSRTWLRLFCPLLPLCKIMFQTSFCFTMKTWMADKVKALKQNKQLWLSFSNIVMMAWKCLAHTMLFLLFQTWIGSEEQRHNEYNWVHISYRQIYCQSKHCFPHYTFLLLNRDFLP